MAWTNVERAVRFLRRRRGWRQSDLGREACVSRETISRIERGRFAGVTVATFDDVARALGASVHLQLRWQGEQLDRLMDAAHASVQESVSRLLSDAGWLVRAEASFNHYGDRGRVDLLAYHESSRVLLVVEIKVGIGDIQETLGRVDVKVRLGPTLAREAGWSAPTRCLAVLVIGDERTSRRVVERHAALFGRFAVRGREALSWVRRPSSTVPSGLLWFHPLPDSHGVTARRRQRLRPPGNSRHP